MVLTKEFKQLVQQRALRDEAFRQGLLTESLQCLLNDDIETGKALLRDYIKATIGFEELAKKAHMKPKSIMRGLTNSGNPTSNNLLKIIHTLRELEGVKLTVMIGG